MNTIYGKGGGGGSRSGRATGTGTRARGGSGNRRDSRVRLVGNRGQTLSPRTVARRVRQIDRPIAITRG